MGDAHLVAGREVERIRFAPEDLLHQTPLVLRLIQVTPRLRLA